VVVELLEPIKDLKTTKRFPPSLRGTIYEAMLEAISEELSVWRDAIHLQKTSFYDVDLMDVARLTEICGTFGVPFITSVKSDIFFLREEVRSIPMKIYYKGTPTLYKSFFYAVGRYGEMFIYAYRADVNNIVRSMLDPFDEAYLTPPNLTFRHKSRGDFSGSIEGWLKLDTDLYLDAGDALWKLDTSATEITTNHIGLEYFIDRIILRDNANIVTKVDQVNEYLMTNEYLDYMNQSIEFARRAKEVPHIGSQLSVQSEADGLCNSYDPTSEYSVPSLKLKVVTRPDFFSLVSSPHDISYVEFGIGHQPVASVQNPDVPFPSELASKVCSVSVLFRDQIGDSHFIGAIGEYLGQSLNGFKILDGSAFDGALQDFNFTLPFTPIQRGNVVLTFHLPTGESLQVSDDRRGLLISINGYGTVDYKTGECHLSTKFDYPQVDNMEMVVTPGYSDPIKSRIHFTHTLQGGTSVVPSSLWLTFTIGDDAAQRTYMVNDDGNGNFVHSLIQLGVVDYATKVVDIIFTVPLVDPDVKPFNCKYSFPVDFKLPAGTELLASYFFTQQSINITEAGFRSKDGDLLNYATFPPFEFCSTTYHLEFMVLVKKPELQ
jgi:hypothetical protein